MTAQNTSMVATDDAGNPTGSWVTLTGGATVFVPANQMGYLMQGGGAQQGAAGGGGGGGGNFNLPMAVDAGQAVYNILSYDNMRDHADRARRKRRELRRLKEELQEIPDSASVATLRDKMVQIVDKQEEVDRAQTEAIEIGTKVVLVDGLAAGGRFLGRLGTAGNGGGGAGNNPMMNAVVPAIATLGVAALIWGDDDDGGRRRGRF